MADLAMLCAPSTAGAMGLALLVVCLIIQRVRGYARMRHIPGPFWAGWTDLWLIYTQLSGRMCFILADANKKYGTLSLWTTPAITRVLTLFTKVPSQKSHPIGWYAVMARNYDVYGGFARPGNDHIGIAAFDLTLTRTTPSRFWMTRSTKN